MDPASSTTAEPLEFSGDDTSSYAIKLHINTGLTVVASLLAGYMIVFSSGSKSMGHYKWYLFNIVATSLLFDIYVTMIVTPFPLMPAIGLCSLGLLKVFGRLWGVMVPFMLMLELLSLCGMSVLLAALYRLLAVYNLQRHMTRGSILAVLAVAELVYLAPALLVGCLMSRESYENQSAIVNATLVKYPGLAPILDSNVCALYDSSTALFKWTVYFCTAELVVMVAIAVTIWIVSLVRLRRRKKEMSKRTYQLHRQLIIALAMQFLVPGASLALPFFLLAITLVAQTGTINGHSGQFFSQLGTSHSFLNAITLILCTKPYRRVVQGALSVAMQKVKEWVFCGRHGSTTAITTPTASKVSTVSFSMPISAKLSTAS